MTNEADLNKMMVGANQYEGEQKVSRGMPEETKGVMLELLNTEKIVTTIDLQLQGMGIDPLKTSEDGGAMWTKIAEPYLHKDLRIQLINLVRSHLNTITLYSNINQEIIEHVCIDLHCTITDLLFMNEDMIRCRTTRITNVTHTQSGHEIEVWANENKGESDVWTRAELVLYMIMDAVWIGLYQAFEHGQREMIIKSGGWSESTVRPLETKKRKKLLGVI